MRYRQRYVINIPSVPPPPPPQQQQPPPPQRTTTNNNEQQPTTTNHPATTSHNQPQPTTTSHNQPQPPPPQQQQQPQPPQRTTTNNDEQKPATTSHNQPQPATNQPQPATTSHNHNHNHNNHSPRLGRVGLRPAPPSGAVAPCRCEMRRQQPHRWAFERKACRCTLCSRVAKGRSQHNKPAPGRCPNVRNIEHHDRFRLEAQGHGHVIWGAFHGSSPFFYCVRCGAHAGWCMRRLAQKVVRPVTKARGSAAVC